VDGQGEAYRRIFPIFRLEHPQKLSFMFWDGILIDYFHVESRGLQGPPVWDCTLFPLVSVHVIIPEKCSCRVGTPLYEAVCHATPVYI
jgi:hypothetical protein